MYTGSLEAQSNQATWIGAFYLYDGTVGPDEYIDITGCTVTMTLRDESGRDHLTVSSTDGTITFPENGMFQWEVAESQMNNICAGTYDVGLRISQNDKVVQLLIGSIPILDGIDRQ